MQYIYQSFFSTTTIFGHYCCTILLHFFLGRNKLHLHRKDTVYDKIHFHFTDVFMVGRASCIRKILLQYSLVLLCSDICAKHTTHVMRSPREYLA